MNIVVCIKQVPNTNKVRLDPQKGTLIREGIPNIINPDDKAALEAALRIKDAIGAKVWAITMGPLQAAEVLHEAYAMGADETVLVTDRAFGGADTWATSSTLAAAVRKLPYDLVITGQQAIDGDTAQVGPQVAEHLRIPNVSYVEDIQVEDGHALVKRQFEDRYHMLRVKLPCLLTAVSELAKPRYMKPGRIFEFYDEREITVWKREDLDVEDGNIGLKGSPTRVVKSFAKELKGKGTVARLDAEDAAVFLVEKLQETFIF